MKTTTNPMVVAVPARTGVRGRLDKLAEDYARKAMALKIALEILDADDRQTALDDAPRKFLHAINHRVDDDGEPVVLKRLKKSKTKEPRMSPTERRAIVSDYIAAHPSASTREVADALGWNANTAWRFLGDVATATKAKGNAPSTWVLKGARAAKTAKVEKPKRDVRLPRAERVEQIRQYLTAHPEALTIDIAKALRVTPRSSFVSIVREVARPVRPTTSTQPINWVLK